MPRWTYAVTLSRWAAEISGPVSAASSNGPPIRIRRARRTSASTNRSCRDSSTTRRAPAEHTWPEWTNAAFRALSSAASKSASANTTLGFLPPSSSATFFTVAAAAAATRLPVSSPPVNGDEVHVGVLRQRRARHRSGPEHEVRHPVGKAGLGEDVHEQHRGVRRELAGLEDEGVARGEGRRDLPGGLQQRVVPGRDESADTDRLVADPAHDVRVAGVDHPSGRVAGELAEVAEAVRDVGHVEPALDEPLAGVEGLRAGERLGAVADQVGDPEQQVAACGGRGARPGTVVERPPGRRDRPLDVPRRGLGHRADVRAVGRAADLADVTGRGRHPRAVDEERCWRGQCHHPLALPPPRTRRPVIVASRPGRRVSCHRWPRG